MICRSQSEGNHSSTKASLTKETWLGHVGWSGYGNGRLIWRFGLDIQPRQTNYEKTIINWGFDLYSQFAINILTILIICENFCIFTLLKMRENSSLKYIYPVYGYNIFGRQTETRLSTICLNIFLVTKVFMAQNINKTLISLFRWVVSNSVAKLISCITETKSVFWISCMDMFN